MGSVTLVKIRKSELKRKGNAPGTAAVVTSDGVQGQVIEAEVYQAPGILAMPGQGAMGVWVPVGGAERYGVVIACHNYSINISVDEGETAIYSTRANGSLGGLIRVLKDGAIELNGNGKRLVTHAELESALAALCSTLATHVHPSHGTPSPQLIGLACDISAAKTTTIETGG